MIETGEISEVFFPVKAKKLVKDFILCYREELLKMWETEQYIKLAPID